MSIEPFIDLKTIVQIAVFMVGITQLVKQFFEVKHRRTKIVMTVLVGIGAGVLLRYVPAWIFTTMLGVSVGVVFYDYVLKALEKLFRGAEQ